MAIYEAPRYSVGPARHDKDRGRKIAKQIIDLVEAKDNDWHDNSIVEPRRMWAN